MSIEQLFYMERVAPESAIPELSVVALRSALALADDRVLSIDAEGTVVGVWENGTAYVVEFDEPFHAVATVQADLLREIVRFTG